MIISKHKFFFILLFYFNFLNLIGYETKIIVKIDNNVITNYDLKNKILTTLTLANEEINQENIDRVKPLALKSLIDLNIKKIEVNKFKVKTTPLELQNNLNLIAKNNLENFKKIFLINKLDYDGYKTDLETELKWRKLIYFIYKKKVKIEKAEIDSQLDKYLQENKNNLIEYKLSELVISYESLEERDKKIKQINSQINEFGFENTLIKFNESLSKESEGDLGWINSESLSKNILDAIKNLKINDITKPIILGKNILYLKIKDKRESNAKNQNIDEIKKQIIKAKENQRFTLYSNSHLSKLRNLTTIEYK
tara:strand:- start:2102 stop:3031 length:930 start_codon:yes stop_codon:yes gene_type:complete